MPHDLYDDHKRLYDDHKRLYDDHKRHYDDHNRQPIWRTDMTQPA